MTGTLGRYLAAWSVLTLLGVLAIYAQSRMTLAPLPDAAARTWAASVLADSLTATELPAAPPSAERYRPLGPVFVSAYVRGELISRHVGDGTLAQTVRAAAKAFAADEKLRSAVATLRGKQRPRFRVEVTRGSAPLLGALPWLSVFALVPLREGLCAELDEKRACITPDEIWSLGLYDRAVVAPVPDLTFGTDVKKLEARLARALSAPVFELRARGRVRRTRIEPLDPWPAETQGVRPKRGELRTAAREGARFLLRHQSASGRYTYVYDAQRDRAVSSAGYSMPRHGGTTFFLAQAARVLSMQEARDGALRALSYLRKTALSTCGSSERLCVVQDGDVEFGGTALAALAAAELLRSGDDEPTRALLAGLTAFLRSQQREDGELMHEYDRKRHRPIDVQHMYYSGEAGLALLSAYEQTRDRRDLEAARRLMKHLTGAGWSFFGSRYFYGEEHWTCQAVGKAAAHMDVTAALDFCLRWARWQGRLQYRAGETPWPVEGALGVGPVLVPRVTMPASRVEASVPIFRVLSARGEDVRELRTLIERSLGALLRTRWAPGPAHLFRFPGRAQGGMPGTAVELTSRADMVQHAGSAMLAWAEDGVFDAP